MRLSILHFTANATTYSAPAPALGHWIIGVVPLWRLLYEVGFLKFLPDSVILSLHFRLYKQYNAIYFMNIICNK